jgi:hypothetical protein
MLWIEAAVAVLVGLMALMAVILAARPTEDDELGSVSHQWIAEHRVDSQ